MPFFQVDDQLHLHEKPTSLVESHGVMGIAAIGLWTMAGSQAQAKLTDGLVSSADLVRLVLDKRLATKLAALLVDAGLWHGADHGCENCPPVAKDHFLFHDWFEIGYSPGVKVKLTRARRKEIRNPEVIEAVWARDGSQCRYCGRSVKRGDHKSPNRPTLDHVIPSRAMGPTNVVIACLPCNQKKGQRTPEQAGMTLLDPPIKSTLISNGSESDSTSDRDRIPAIPHRARTGPRSGSGSDQVTGIGPAGEVPPIDVPGQIGSPWYGHHGASTSEHVDNCSTHGLEMPCRKCTADEYDQTAAT